MASKKSQRPSASPPKRKVGRPAAGAEARTERVTVVLTKTEHAQLVGWAENLGVPLFLYARWLLTKHPIPGERK